MADIKDKIRKALFLPATAHARYNLEGALHDLERLRGMDLPPDMVCIHTIDRVIKQLAKAERVLDGDG